MGGTFIYKKQDLFQLGKYRDDTLTDFYRNSNGRDMAEYLADRPACLWDRVEPKAPVCMTCHCEKCSVR